MRKKDSKCSLFLLDHKNYGVNRFDQKSPGFTQLMEAHEGNFRFFTGVCRVSSRAQSANIGCEGNSHACLLEKTR